MVTRYGSSLPCPSGRYSTQKLLPAVGPPAAALRSTMPYTVEKNRSRTCRRKRLATRCQIREPQAAEAARLRAVVHGLAGA